MNRSKWRQLSRRARCPALVSLPCLSFCHVAIQSSLCSPNAPRMQGPGGAERCRDAATGAVVVRGRRNRQVCTSFNLMKIFAVEVYQCKAHRKRDKKLLLAETGFGAAESESVGLFAPIASRRLKTVMSTLEFEASLAECCWHQQGKLQQLRPCGTRMAGSPGRASANFPATAAEALPEVSRGNQAAAAPEVNRAAKTIQQFS